MSPPAPARPYRSKRHRPCDQCRGRKLGCQIDDGLPCQRCRASKLDCTFDAPPPKRVRLSQSLSVAEPSVEELSATAHGDVGVLGRDASQEVPLSTAEPVFPSLEFDQINVASPASGILLAGRPPTQFVQSIDKLDQGYAQLFGASSESDPWLLRHCRFDDSGMKHFYKVHYRNAGGVPTAQRIPVHFMITSPELSTAIKQETNAGLCEGARETREKLDNLVPPEYGRRLVALWVIPFFYFKDVHQS